MKAILVDDENPALMQLERLIQSDGRIQVAGKYTQARTGLDHVSADRVEIVFMDIEMPGMNGLEAAEHFYLTDPDVQIVYVTAYNDYAIEAFELNAVDYLLKPVDPERFSKTVSRLESRLKHVKLADDTSLSVEKQIICFHRIDFRDSSGNSSNLKWRTQKAQELFAFLVHHRNKWVDKDLILETLWPDLIQDKAVTQLHTSVYQVRKMLKTWGLDSRIDYSHDSYRFIQGNVKLDVDRFLQAAGLEEVVGHVEWQQLVQGLAVHQGDYLGEHDYIWSRSVREEYSRQYMKSSLMAAAYEEKSGHTRAALMRLLELQKREPFSEEVCRMTIQTYVLLREKPAAGKYYESFAALLMEELDAVPEAETRELYEGLMSDA